MGNILKGPGLGVVVASADGDGNGINGEEVVMSGESAEAEVVFCDLFNQLVHGLKEHLLLHELAAPQTPSSSLGQSHSHWQTDALLG